MYSRQNTHTVQACTTSIIGHGTFVFIVKEAHRFNRKATKKVLSVNIKQQQISPLLSRKKADKTLADPFEQSFSQVRRSKSVHTRRDTGSAKRNRSSTIFYTDQHVDVTTPFTTDKELSPLHVNDKNPEQLIELLKKVHLCTCTVIRLAVYKNTSIHIYMYMDINMYMLSL